MEDKKTITWKDIEKVVIEGLLESTKEAMTDEGLTAPQKIEALQDAVKILQTLNYV